MRVRLPPPPPLSRLLSIMYRHLQISYTALKRRVPRCAPATVVVGGIPWSELLSATKGTFRKPMEPSHALPCGLNRFLEELQLCANLSKDAITAGRNRCT